MENSLEIIYKGRNGLDKLDLGCLFILVFMRFLEGENGFAVMKK